MKTETTDDTALIWKIEALISQHNKDHSSFVLASKIMELVEEKYGKR